MKTETVSRDRSLERNPYLIHKIHCIPRASPLKQVLTYVNRTLATLRARLRREWRLHPLTPGHLAKIALEFLQWGR